MPRRDQTLHRLAHPLVHICLLLSRPGSRFQTGCYPPVCMVYDGMTIPFSALQHLDHVWQAVNDVLGSDKAVD